MFQSFQETLIKFTVKDSGRFHTMFLDAPLSSINIVENNKKFENYFYLQNIGYAEFDSRNVNLPYLYIKSLNSAAFENASIILIEGRIPQNENEIILTKDVNISTNNEYQISDIMTLDLFDMIVSDELNNFSNESINYEKFPLFIKTYKVVGIAENVSNYLINSFFEHTILALTYIDNPTDDINLFVYYNNPKEVDEITNTLAASFGLSSERVFYHNHELLRWQGVMDDDNLKILYTIAGIVIAVIIVTSIFVIKNGFAISVTERKKEFGILSSMGATQKQIKKSILYEGFILGIIAIPIGILCGIIAVWCLIFCVNILR